MTYRPTHQGRTQDFFPGGGGKIIAQYSREKASEGSGGGCGRGVSPPTPGSFCIFDIDIGRSGAHLAWIFGGTFAIHSKHTMTD